MADIGAISGRDLVDRLLKRALFDLTIDAAAHKEIVRRLSELDKRDELRPYMQHKGTCFIYPCTCGLSELLKRLPD